MTGRVQVYAVDDLAGEEGWRETTERAARDGCVSCGGGRIVGHVGGDWFRLPVVASSFRTASNSLTVGQDGASKIDDRAPYVVTGDRKRCIKATMPQCRRRWRQDGTYIRSPLVESSVGTESRRKSWRRPNYVPPSPCFFFAITR